MILKTADWKVTKFISKFIEYTWRILSFRHVHVDTNANLKPQICDRPVLMVTSLMPKITKLLRFYSKELQSFSCYVHLSYRVTFLCKNSILHDDQVKHSDKRFREWEALALPFCGLFWNLVSQRGVFILKIFLTISLKLRELIFQLILNQQENFLHLEFLIEQMGILR